VKRLHRVSICIVGFYTAVIIADLATTFVGLSRPGIIEMNPFLNTNSWVAMVQYQILTLIPFILGVFWTMPKFLAIITCPPPRWNIVWRDIKHGNRIRDSAILIVFFILTTVVMLRIITVANNFLVLQGVGQLPFLYMQNIMQQQFGLAPFWAKLLGNSVLYSLIGVFLILLSPPLLAWLAWIAREPEDRLKKTHEHPR